MPTNTPSPDSNAECWVLHDGAAGNRRQAVALAQALHRPFREIVLAPRWPARWLAPRRLGAAAMAFGAQFAHDLSRSPPALAIGCGRIAALATRLAREHGARAVQILDPRVSPRYWDALVVPQHDGLRGPSVLSLLGSLHPVDDDWLEQARREHPSMAALATPLTAVLVGGPTASVPFDLDALERMLAKLEAARARDGGSLVICASRRTPPAWSARLRERCADSAQLWLGAQDGDNPYAGALAWATRLVVTPDSVNMLSEACATRAPVYVAEPELARGRLRRFLDSLAARGRIHPQDTTLAQLAAEPLRETPRVAAELRSLLDLD